MRFKDRVRELRTNKDLTLKDLSERTGLSMSYLSDLERGKTNPSLKTMEVLADAFHVSLQTLVTGVELIEEQPKQEDLPEGLRELINDERYKDRIDTDWIELLNKIQMRGKRPETKEDWLELYLHLKRVLGD